MIPTISFGEFCGWVVSAFLAGAFTGFWGCVILYIKFRNK